MASDFAIVKVILNGLTFMQYHTIEAKMRLYAEAN